MHLGEDEHFGLPRGKLVHKPLQDAERPTSIDLEVEAAGLKDVLDSPVAALATSLRPSLREHDVARDRDDPSSDGDPRGAFSPASVESQEDVVHDVLDGCRWDSTRPYDPPDEVAVGSVQRRESRDAGLAVGVDVHGLDYRTADALVPSRRGTRNSVIHVILPPMAPGA